MNRRDFVCFVTNVVNQYLQQILGGVWFVFYNNVQHIITNNFQMEMDSFVVMETHDVKHHVVHILFRFKLQVKGAVLPI